MDDLSSAHVYLRMAEVGCVDSTRWLHAYPLTLLTLQGASWDDIPAALLTDCVQLVKANSIEGAFLACVHELCLIVFACNRLEAQQHPRGVHALGQSEEDCLYGGGAGLIP